MEQPQKLMGRVVALDSVKRRVTIEVDFFDPDKQEMIEAYLKSQEEITFGFWKPFRRTKTVGQLRKYYLLLHKLLNMLGIYPNSDAVKALDEEIKKRVFNCDVIEMFGQKVPLVPSKANMSVEDMNQMIKFIVDNYGIVLEDGLEVNS